ncbi:hypothetical protein J2752_002088 [Halarchaeum rubridurum]|uniref:Uncharacterized protein n=1 Tax=Halarchaeum rubridurum TaxID=489911 RepID=A0A830FZU3_9EURY|nr:hypothetical protein [Halarchaeum rubridurum]MBP1955176.1 hypothetical protein [Halarchaeum rubridurum]GGM68336.1 hypothetical protein GCM10009017_18190 [Halarchaeum rubridurum]
MKLDPFPDQRGRVPFAVIGALLLLTSAALGAGIAGRPAPSGYDAGPALDASWTATHAATERAVLRASVDAARHPVLERADTPYGRVLNASDPFRDALRLRVYLAVADALPASAVTLDGVTATASLPEIDSPADADAAIDRVTLTGVESDTALRVRIDGVRVVATRARAVVESRERSITVTAPTPVLAVHERVGVFETRLDRGVADGPGLARRATVSLTALAEARGLAQYGGAPITNVVANRHVALATNRGVLSLERATFGSADPLGVSATRRAAVTVAAKDLLAGARATADGRNGTGAALANEALSRVDPGTANPQPVPLEPAADDALVAFSDGDGHDSLDGTIRRAYAVAVRLGVRVSSDGRPPTPAVSRGYTRVDSSSRSVTVGNESYRVAVVVGARPVTGRGLPDVSDGPSWVRERAVRRAIDDALGRSLARRAVAGTLDTRFVVHPDVPASRRRAVLDALGRTHAALRNVTTHAERRVFLDGDPLADLPPAVDATVAGMPASPTVDERAGALARAAYADRVRETVAARRSTLATAQTALRERLTGSGVAVTPPALAGPDAPPVPMTVSADPAYLSLARVTPADAPVADPAYPLAARNDNLFTVPSADIVERVFAFLRTGHAEPVSYAVAAQTLSAAERAGVERAALEHAVVGASATARETMAATLRRHTTLPSAARERALDAAFARWSTPGTRALAVANGSLPAALADEAAARGAARPGFLAARLGHAVRDRQSGTALVVGGSAVDPVRERVVGTASDAVGTAAERALARSTLALLPSGLPLLPLPGQWYVTANAWHVAARGGYARFAVAVPLGRPGVADGSLRYVRANAPVTLDVDGDGRAERLGRNRRIDFGYRTGVVAVVPPGPRGVGDVGRMTETSAGWTVRDE